MLFDHIRIALRKMVQNKTFFTINLVGFVIGITIFLFIAQFVNFELSFEDYNENADRAYRVNLYNTQNGIFQEISSQTVSGLAHDMRETLPGIQRVARLTPSMTGIVRNNEKNIEDIESRIILADPSVLDVLAIDLIQGSNEDVLRSPESIIISHSQAIKYFKQMNVVGNELEITLNEGGQSKLYHVQGVYADIPANANLRFDFILPAANEQDWNTNWAWSNVYTFVLLKENTNWESLTSGLAAIVRKHHKDAETDKYLLEPITEIRLRALDGSGRQSQVNFFSLFGIVILLLGWFNYINLFTARFLDRIKEVGVRKLLGSSRRQLIVQILLESCLFNILCFAIAVLLFMLLWPSLADSFHLQREITIFSEPVTLPMVTAFILLGTGASGFYPAIFFSSFKPLQVLKGHVHNQTGKAFLRKALIVFQLSVSFILITAILAIRNQIDFMSGQDLGISMDRTIIIQEPLLKDANTINRYEPFKNEILGLPSVTGVTFASSFPGSEIDWHRTDIKLDDENPGVNFDSRIVSIGEDFGDVFGISLLAGRNFDMTREGDEKALVINEQAVRMFGFGQSDDALGKIIFIGSRRFEVVGVIKDYHFRSFRHALQSILYMKGSHSSPTLAIKIASKSDPQILSEIESKWKAAYPGNVFKYYFLDDEFEKQYGSEKQLATLVAVLTFFAIVISCSGLFGLSLYSVNRRTKEIGIKKVLGASVFSVVIDLSKDLFKLMAVGIGVGIPIVYFSIAYWLSNYTYKMPIDVLLILVPILITVFLAFVSTWFQTTAAARKNPVDSIKYE